MIGVAAGPNEREAASEFFQLFKTPWELIRSDSHYDVILSTSAEPVRASCRLLLLFNSGPTFFDRERGLHTRSQTGGVVAYDSRRIPIYGTVTMFPGNNSFVLKEESNGEAAGCLEIGQETITLRIGYDLLGEVHVLLSVGQPLVNASIPTLDEHISSLREWITSAGIPLVEIPPAPEGYSFITCLTHDIDHPAVRRHLCDHTMFGFIYRSTIGTWLNVWAKKRSRRTLLRNWKAACLLPFVHLRLAKDFWSDFDRYLEMENGAASTYFVIPRNNYPGRTAHGYAPPARACKYTLGDVLPQLKKIMSAKCEVGVHGVDAWLDPEAGRAEREAVARAIGATELGVRMHWLFFEEASPRSLERAGFSYDSTVGYRETIGYRTGTLQVYKPLGATRLLELPLHVMDTALFYPSYLNLHEDEARQLVWKLIDDAERMGGSFTVNWHDRSISPERLWDDFYLKLVHELRSRKAWLATASQAVAWFRKRRSVTFETLQLTNTRLIRASFEDSDSLPGLRLRVHQPRAAALVAEPRNTGVVEFEDLPLTRTTELTLPI